MSSGEQGLKKQAQSAFRSPTALASQRLGNRVSPRGSDASTVHSATSRRSQSLIRSPDQAELFSEIATSTSVLISPKRTKNKVKSTAPSADSSSGSVHEMIRGAAEGANQFMQSFAPATSTTSQPTGSSWSDGRSLEKPPSRALQNPSPSNSTTTSNRSNLDLRHNDNSFHVLASLLVEFFQSKLVPGDQNPVLMLNPDDRKTVQRLLPESARVDFIQAVRYRLSRMPSAVATTPLQRLTLQCQELGLDRDGPDNPVLAALHYLKDEPMSVHAVGQDPPAAHPEEKKVSEQQRMTEQQQQQQRMTEQQQQQRMTEQQQQQQQQLEQQQEQQQYSTEQQQQSKRQRMTEQQQPPEQQRLAEQLELRRMAEQQQLSNGAVVLVTGDSSLVTNPSSYASAMESSASVDHETARVSIEPPGAVVADATTTSEPLLASETDVIEPASERSVSFEPDVTERATVPVAVSSEPDASHVEPEPGIPRTTAADQPIIDVTSAAEATVATPRISGSAAARQAASEPTVESVSPAGSSGTGGVLRDANHNNSADSSGSAAPSAVDFKRSGQQLHEQQRRSQSSSPVVPTNPFASTSGSAADPNAPPFAAAATPIAAREDAHDTPVVDEQLRAKLEEQKMQISQNVALQKRSASPLGDSGDDSLDLSTSTENLARQQLLAELREASNLMAESVTPETSKFWRDHVLDLQARLRVLHGESPKGAAIRRQSQKPADTVDSRQQALPDVQNHVETPELAAANTQQSQKPADSLEDNRRDAQRTGKTPPKRSKSMRTQKPGEMLGDIRRVLKGAAVVEQSEESVDEVEETRRAISQAEQRKECAPPPITSTSRESYRSEPRAQDQEMAPIGTPKEFDYEASMVDVIAPANLPGGYNFEAEIEGQRFLATVPPGGVQQGETFTCRMRELNSVAIDIPVGYWKDKLTDALKYGCCHPVVWNGIFCPLILISQIQHRISLDFLGRPREGEDNIPNRSTMWLVISFWFFINIALFGAYNIKWSRGIELSIADMAAFALINGAMYGFVVFVAQSTRNTLREKFLIREERCHDLEDLCCATWCLPCTVCQMSRHTANYDYYEAVCCSKSGLPDGVRVNQTSAKETNMYMV